MSHSLRRVASVLGVLVGVYLLVSLVPVSVAAAGTNTAVGASHTTATDFNAGTLTNMSVSGSGSSATVDLSGGDTVENAERGNITPYAGDTGRFAASTNNPIDGSYSIESSGSGTAWYGMTSLSGLPHYPAAGDNFSFLSRQSTHGMGDYFFFGAQDAPSNTPSNTYQIHFGAYGGALELDRIYGGSLTQLDSQSILITPGDIYRVRVDWGASGHIVVTLTDKTTGSTVATVSATDTTFSSGGIGYRYSTKGTGGTVSWDDVKILRTGPSSSRYLSAPESVMDPTSMWANIQSISNASATVTAEYKSGGSWHAGTSNTYTTAGNKTLTLTHSADQWRLNVTVNKTGSSPSFSLSSDGVLFSNHAPGLVNTTATPSGGTTKHYANATLSIDANDTEFPTAEGDSVSLDWYLDGSKVATTSGITANATETHGLTGLADGSHTWHVVATDSYGGTQTSQTFSFTVAHATPTIDNASLAPNGTTKHDSAQTFSLDVNDSDFARDGDSVNVSVYVDGSYQGHDTLTANGTASVGVTGLSDGSHTWHAVATDSYGNSVTSATASVTITHFAPTVDNSSATPKANTTISSLTPTLSIDANDSDFHFQGDSLNVSMYLNGSYQGHDTLTANGTASVAPSVITGGHHRWHAVVSDSYGNSVTSQTFYFRAPGKLYIRPVNNTSALVAGPNTTVTLRFYSSNTVVQKNTTTGMVNLTGLPVDQELVVTVDAPGYYNRRTLLPSIISQPTVYLLNDTAQGVDVQFELNDLTGDYPLKSTELKIERAVVVNGSAKRVIISGDYFGAGGTFPTTLEYYGRYYLTITNSKNQSRELGPYTPQTGGTIPLDVGLIHWDATTPDHPSWNSSLVNTSTGGTMSGYLHFQYQDAANNTTDLNVVMYEQGNKSNEIYNNTIAGPLGTFAVNRTLTGGQVNNSTWIVSFTAQRGGKTISSKAAAEAKSYHLENPFSSNWGKAIAAGALVFCALIFGGLHSAKGGLIVAGFGGVLYYIGWYSGTVGVVILALLVGGLFAVGDSGGGR